MGEAGISGARRRLRFCTALVSATSLFPAVAFAQSTWTGAGGNDFSDGANWNTAPVAPGAADAASVTSGTPIVATSTTVNTLTVSGGTLKINADLAATNGTTVFDLGRIEVPVGGNLISNVTLTDGYLGISGTLTGDLDASGGTVINDGRITGETFIDGGTATNNGTLRDLIIASGGIVTNNATATVTGTTNVVDGTLTNNGGLGAVDIGAAGTFTSNTGATVGALTNAGNASNAGSAASLANTGGSFTNNAGGNVTGATTVSGGTVANNATLGAVTVGIGATFTNNTGATAGAVSNAGNASNAGTLASLDNTGGSFTNNFGGSVTGATTITGGNVTNNAALGAVAITSGGGFANNTGATAGALTNAGNTSNAGTIASLVNAGGSFTNNAGGNVTGTTTVSGGTVTNNDTLGAVDVTAGGSFVNNLGAVTATLTNAGTASNNGTINALFNNGGTFSNNGTIMGLATITGGMLINDGTITGGIALYTGGMLAGSGSIGGLTIGAGGLLSPGPGFATMTVNGDLTFETGSTYQVETDPSGLSDAVNATGAVKINGGTLEILAGTGAYGLSTAYTILTGGSLTGAFDTVTTDMAFLSPILTYGPTGVTLDLYRNTVSFADVAQTGNGRATAAGVESLGGTNPLFLAVLPLDATVANSAFQQLTGEIHGSVKSQLLQDSRFVRDAIVDRMNGAVPTQVIGAGEATAWMTGFSATGHTACDGNAAGITGRTGGVVAGADAQAFDHLRLGGVIGYSHSAVGRQADVDSYHAGLYATADWGAFAFTGGGLYSKNQLSTDRNVAFGTFADRLKADYDGATAQLFADLSWRMRAGGVEWQPFANLAYVNLTTDGFRESGGTAALSARRGTDDITMTTFGLRWATDLPIEIMPVTLSGMLGWRHAVGDLTPSSQMTFASGGSPFVIEGVGIPRDAVVVEAGLTAPLSKAARLKLTYTGEFARHLATHAARISLVVDF